jgi:hypothetical protein
MRNFVGSLALGACAFLIIVVVGVLLGGHPRTLYAESIAFHMGLGVYFGLRFATDFKNALIWRHLGTALCVYFPAWALFQITAPVPSIVLSVAERGLTLGALAMVSMWMTLLLYEAVQRREKSLLIDEQYAPDLGGNSPPAPTHWIDAHQQALLATNTSTAGQVAAAEWACRAWDYEVVRLYKLLLKSVNHDLGVVLAQSQKEWVKLRQSDTLFGDLVYDKQQGTMYAPMQACARAQISKDRALRLQQRLELLGVNIPASGPRSVPSEPLSEQDFISDNEIPGHGGNPS